MSAFLLNSLNERLLEAVITKLEARSYFRLQRTCRWIGELIQNSQNISVLLESSPLYSQHFQNAIVPEPNGTKPSFKLSMERAHPNCKRELSDFYGIRFEMLRISGYIASLESLMDCLKMNRITCARLVLSRCSWSNEQLLFLLEILKPVQFFNFDGYLAETEPLFAAKTIKSLFISLEPEVIIAIAARMLSTFEVVEISTSGTSSLCQLVTTILEILCANQLPALRKFNMWINDSHPYYAELRKHLNHLTWTDNRVGSIITMASAVIDTPQPQSFLKIDNELRTLVVTYSNEVE